MYAKVISSLHKVFPGKEPEDFALAGQESVFLNEPYSFQIAYIAQDDKKWFKLKTELTKPCDVKVYSVGLVPSELPAYCDYDENYITTEPGLFPDVLNTIGDGYECFAQPGFWRSLWVDVMPDKKAGAGKCNVSIKFIDEEENEIFQIETNFEIIDSCLPKQKLIRTEWFHCDCISNYYNVPMMSDEHWELIERFIKAASGCGINMILTPIFTPPLDTKVGGERPTMQLVDVIYENGVYNFGFDKLKRWIDMCQRSGIEYFEMSHLFTQWGALHAPKIIAETGGRKEKIFGWGTDASSEGYTLFLDAFLPQLVEKLKKWNLEGKVRFHVSDEPAMKDIESYRAASGIVKKHLTGFPVMDALSDIEFYETGLVEHPIPSNNHIEPFLEKRIENLWTYYCCGQHLEVSNRFFAMPSARNRIFGMQLFKYDIEGFLHWGFNFWNSQYSKRAINPYITTDADCAFPSGDAFLVYPGKDGPTSSIRMRVFSQALYDLRAFRMLAELISRESVIELMEKEFGGEITFKEYPQNISCVLNIRKKVNVMIESVVKKG